MKVSNHLKFIANEFPVTLVLVGVGLTEAGLFTEGRTVRESTLAQTGRRTTRLTVERFDNTLQEQIGYESARGDASAGWLRLGALVLAAAALAALLINRRLPI